jgi:bifunctional DNA-binding transcriptional regulator/antitoxin component of YhaV-PrlF toxin-antitoxin module
LHDDRNGFLLSRIAGLNECERSFNDFILVKVKDMTKVASKLQVTIPKILAEQYSIHPGDELDWLPDGDAIRVIPASNPNLSAEIHQRVRLFDQATERQKVRHAAPKRQPAGGRDWRWGNLYAAEGSSNKLVRRP